MKISILIPCYNASKYVDRAVKSIQDSTYQDFEIICINDGSTDNTLEILKELEKEDNRISIITRQEKGYAFTMNDGLNNATGDFILNVDPDDWIEPTMLEKMITNIGDCDFIKCGFWFEFKEGSTEYLYSGPEKVFCPRFLPPDKKMNFYNSQVAIWSCLIKRSFIEKHNLRLNETPGAAYQDTCFWYKAHILADKVKILNEPLYHYNKTNDNASTASTRYPMGPINEYRALIDWVMNRPELALYVRTVLTKCRFGSYMWNCTRIKKEDIPRCVYESRDDFIKDWEFLDTRMFTDREFNIYMMVKEKPEEIIKLLEVT